MSKYIFLIVVTLIFGLQEVFSINLQDKKKVIVMKNLDEKENSGWLGVMLKQVNDEKVEIEEVMENSPAKEAGLQNRDVINSINDKEIKKASDVVEIIKELKPKTKITINILREKLSKDISVTLGERPKEKFHEKEFEMEMPNDFSMQMQHMPMMKHFDSKCSEPKVKLGMEVETLNKQLAEYFDSPDKKGVLVKNVEEESIASKAGFKAGDVIVKMGIDRIKNVNDITELLEDVKKDDKIEFEVMRKNSRKKISVVVDKINEQDCNLMKHKNGFGNEKDFFIFKHKEKMEDSDKKMNHPMSNLAPNLKEKQIKIEIIDL